MLSITKEKLIRTLRRVLVLLVLYFAQNALAWVRIAGAAPLLLVSGAIALVMLCDGEWSAAWGLFAGILCDISTGGRAFYTLVLMILGLAMGMLVQFYLARTAVTFMLGAIAANAVVVALQLVPMCVFRSIPLKVVAATAIAQLVYAVVLALPVYELARLIAGSNARSRR
ncbi:MAG: hypothetical protein LBC65_06195 [Oscillospiraceae bacterium]|jgi:hypothetical protein|nr:hypothetical protein [Oscillospiraceae bacterium]